MQLGSLHHELAARMKRAADRFAAPIKLQAHGAASSPISYRNIWACDIPDTASLPPEKQDKGGERAKRNKDGLGFLRARSQPEAPPAFLPVRREADEEKEQEQDEE